MRDSRPSRTAYRVALRRAAHQVLDSPRVFDDPLALKIAGAEGVLDITEENSGPRGLRAFMAVRSRYAEDELRRAVERGVRQYVVLGAGLDTFAYRSPWADLRIFEVDHPATQSWKRERVEAAGIAAPGALSYAPVDFERQSLEDGLPAAGFSIRDSAFFSWLGVVPYLTDEAFRATLRFIASLPPASGVAFDFAVDRSLLSAPEQAAFDALASRVASAGEPFRLFFDPQALVRTLRDIGFAEVDMIDTAEINRRYFQDRSDGLRINGSLAHLICSRV